MTDYLTTNYSLNLIPLGNGIHNGLPWGWLVNANFVTVDTQLKTIADGLTASIANHGLPAYTTANNGQYATIVSGAVVWATLPISTTSVLGLVKMATDPADAANPIAVGTNDPRLSDARTPTTHESTHLPGGTDAIPWTTVNGRGTTAAKPAAASGNAGYLYFDTDLGKLQRSTGTAWDDCEGSGGSGGSSFQQFDPHKPPASPSSSSDEFDSGSLTGWTLVNQGSMTYDVGVSKPSALTVYSPSVQTGLFAILKALPAGDFTLYASVNIAGLGANYSECGIILSSTNTYNTGSQTVVEVAFNTAWKRQCINITNFSSAPSYQFLDVASSCTIFLMMRRAGSSYTVGWSQDGATWHKLAVTPGVTPEYMGLEFGNGTGAKAMTYAVDFFRHFPNATATLGGTRTIYGT